MLAEVGECQEPPQFLNCGGHRLVCDCSDLALIHKHTPWSYYVSQESHLMNIKLTLFSFYVELVLEQSS